MTLHEERYNEVVHADFSYKESAEESNLKYLSIEKGDIRSYTRLQPCSNFDSDAAVSTISKWIPWFGMMEWLDQGFRFKTSLMKELATETCIKRHFTTAYFPLASGNVERLYCRVLRITRALLSEWKLSVGQ